MRLPSLATTNAPPRDVTNSRPPAGSGPIDERGTGFEIPSVRSTHVATVAPCGVAATAAATAAATTSTTSGAMIAARERRRRGRRCA